MKPKKIVSKKKNYLFSVISIVLLSSCSLGPQHHVRTGEDPRYQDKDVAFRTTYYFRVFDYCYKTHQLNERSYPKTSGLYRFKMTGKSNTHNNILKFESGVLNSWELDPLGATVIYDKNIGRHRYISADETQNQAIKEQAWQEYKQLQTEYLALVGKLGKSNNTNINNILPSLLTSSLSPKKVIDSTANGLTKSLSEAFSTQKKNLDTINLEVKDAIIKALTDKQTELLINNKNRAQRLLDDKSKAWLIEIIKSSIIDVIKAQISGLSNDAINKAKTKIKWHAFIAQLTGAITFPVADAKTQAMHAALLSEKYKTISQLSDINFVKIIYKGNKVLARDVLAQHYIDELNTKKVTLKPLQNEFDSVYDAQLALLTKADGTLRAMTKEDRTRLADFLISKVYTLFNHNTALNSMASNVPVTFDFDAQPATNNIYAELNQTQLAKDLSEQSNALIQSTVQSKYYAINSPMSTTIDTLKNAMNAKLAISTGTSVTNKAPELKTSNPENEGIRCNQVNKRSGFQILGPEGWRTFNQDERLVMAMYSDNSPITGVLKELSKQVLDAHQTDEPSLLPLVEAELRLTQAKQELATYKMKVTAAEQAEKKQALCQLVKNVNTKLDKASLTKLNADEDC